MNLQTFSYIVALDAHRHFGKAAQSCHVTQPTLSAQIKKMEEELDTVLFERSGKTVWPTPTGVQVIEKAKSILGLIDDMQDLARKDPFSGAIRLGCFPTLAPYLLPKIVPEIRGAFPKIQLFLVEEKTHELVNRLMEGQLDAIIVADPIPDAHFDSMYLFKDNFYLAVPESHRLAKMAKVSVKDFQNERVLLLEEGHCLKDQALDVCSKMPSAKDTDVRATSLETLRYMVAAGIGVTLIPHLCIHKDPHGVVYVPFVDPVPGRTIRLFWRKSSPFMLFFKRLAGVIQDLKLGC